MSDRWIVIPNWHRFQHYTGRRPIWIKSYVALLADTDYLSLSLRRRGILHGIWLLMAESGLELGASPARLGRMLGDETVRTRDLESLADAGFIELSASRPLADRYQVASPEKRREEGPPYPLREGDIPLTPRALGTNPRAVAAREKEDEKEARHVALLSAADAYVATWRGGDSLVFDDSLDLLERETRSTLTRQEREDFWERALDQARNGNRT